MSPLAIFREVLAAYRREWRVLLGAAFLTFAAVNLLERLTPELEADRLTTHAVVEALGLGAAGFAISSFQEAFYEGVVATTVSEWRAGGHRPSLITVARSVRYLPLIAVNIVVALGSAIGLLALLVPGFVFGTYVALAPALVEIETLGVRDSLRRSFELVRGSFWPVFVLIWGAYFATEAATAGLDALLHGLGSEYIATTTAEALIAPFYGLAAVFAAYALIERRVGGTPPPAGEPDS
jgi:putative Ca2+/H+ antiporter (TMEM165/GDT1 family)